MNCHCRELRLQLALHVGQDEGSLPEDLRRRVSVCPDCRHHFKQMKTSIALLQDHEGDDDVHLTKSMWPDLARRMPMKRPSRRWTDRASLFISASAITVASFALFMVPMTDMSGSGPVMTNPVSFPAQSTSFHSQSNDLQLRSAPGHGAPLNLIERLLQEQNQEKAKEREQTGRMLFGPAYER